MWNVAWTLGLSVLLGVSFGCLQEGPETDGEARALTIQGQYVIILVESPVLPPSLVSGDAERIDTRVPFELRKTVGEYVESVNEIAPRPRFDSVAIDPGLVVSELPVDDSLRYDGMLVIEELPASDLDAVSSPCSCETDACLQAWVAENLGCGVCAVLTCGGEVYGHACQSCQ